MAAEKIKKLRAWMTAHKLDAYIVPHADRFQSEYLTPRDERLAWLTGFTGSAGMAVILCDKAALFTDGRYTLQAPKQVNTSLYEILETPMQRPIAYLENALTEGARIGIDPWLFTVNQMAHFKKLAVENHFKIVSIEENPIDILWTDRPVENIVPAEIHSLDHAGLSKDEKVKEIIEKMANGAESILISDPGLVCWLLNLRGRDVAHNPILHAHALIDESGYVTLFTDPRKITDSVRRDLGNHISIEELPRLFNVLETHEAVIQFDPNEAPYAVKEFCRKKKIETVQAENPAFLLRAIKNAAEIKGAGTAHQKDKKAFAAFLEWFGARDFSKEKITELDIVAKLYDCRAVDPDLVEGSFDTIAGFGPNGAIVHYKPDESSNLRLKPDSLLLLDSGAQYKVGTTDITRTLAVGTPIGAMKKHYTAVLKGLIALSTTRFPVGTTGAQLDALARSAIWALGLDYNHGTGHGVGSFMSVHEGPHGISSKNHTVLQPGMILSIEPGLYLEGQYGIRLENLAVVAEDKKSGDLRDMLCFRTLTKVPFDVNLIEWELLSIPEILFLELFDTMRPKNVS